MVRDLLRGNATIARYTLLLRNLYVIYQQLETLIADMPADHPLQQLAPADIRRSAHLINDLSELHGPDWQTQLPTTLPTQQYSAHLQACHASAPIHLASHCYVRYLGDLSGGLIIRRLVKKSLGLADSALAFYNFGAVTDPDSFKQSFRRQIDQLPRHGASRQHIIDEAIHAFRLNIDVSKSI